MIDTMRADLAALSQDDLDQIAYLFVMQHGYEDALALLRRLAAECGQKPSETSHAMSAFWSRIAATIDDEAGTIGRILDRLVPNFMTGSQRRASPVFQMEKSANRFDAHIGARIRALRISLKVPLAVLAEAIDLEPSSLDAAEHGLAHLNGTRLSKAAERLGVYIGYFFEDAPMIALSGDHVLH